LTSRTTKTDGFSALDVFVLFRGAEVTVSGRALVLCLLIKSSG